MNPLYQTNSFSMLPPAPDKCQVCAADAHGDELPHNRDSLYYQFWFSATYNRSPTWMDAALSCSEEVRGRLVEYLRSRGVPSEKIGQ